jgi:hypothetical protein
MAPSDHTPCVVSIATDIPKSRIFRFENFWLLDDQFLGILAECWSETNQHTDCAKALTAKFKAPRKRLREWQASKTGMRTIIANTRVSLQFLEVLGVYRDLSVEEWNFKELLKDHLIYLLEKQWIYWKQRDAIKWVKLGGAGTRFFFHAHATIKHRGNLITKLLSGDGSIASGHIEKEHILWEDFKSRLGNYEFNGFCVDTNFFIQRVDNLNYLEQPFSHEEIDNVIRALPNEKSPKPDGFNNEFLKKSWPIIKQDFYSLCDAFYNNSVCLKSI